MEVIKKATKINDGNSADNKKQQETFTKEQEKAREERIGKAAQAFNKYHLAYANDYNLETEEVVAAAFLENLNCREFFPKRLGGKEGYDKICKEIAAWFEQNK